MKFKFLAVCLIICLLFAGCANDTPDFTLSTTQTVMGTDYPPLKNGSLEDSYIYGKCTDCTAVAITDDMYVVYTTLKYDGKKYDVRIGMQTGRVNALDDKLIGKTIVAYGSLKESDSGIYQHQMFSPMYIELDGEIYSSFDILDYLTK